MDAYCQWITNRFVGFQSPKNSKFSVYAHIIGQPLHKLALIFPYERMHIQCSDSREIHEHVQIETVETVSGLGSA